MKKVYIDANIFIDFLDEQRAMNDINLHEKAVSLFKNLIFKNSSRLFVRNKKFIRLRGRAIWIRNNN